MSSLDGEIRDGRHQMPVRVYYEDTDFSGVVYHASYLRFMERGRTNYLRLLGADHRAMFEQAEKEAPGFAFVVRQMKIDFKKPAHMDDVLDILTSPEEVKGASMARPNRLAAPRPGSPSWPRAATWGSAVRGRRRQKQPAHAPPPAGPRRA